MLFHGLLRRLARVDRSAGDGSSTICFASERGMASEAPARRVREIAATMADDAALVDLLCEGSLPRVQDAIAARLRRGRRVRRRTSIAMASAASRN